MKVRAIKKYHDLKQKKIVNKGTEFEVDEKRADYLVKQKMAEIIDTKATRTVKADGKE